MGWKSIGMVRLDLGPLLQGQMKMAKLKSAYNSLIIGHISHIVGDLEGIRWQRVKFLTLRWP